MTTHTLTRAFTRPSSRVERAAWISIFALITALSAWVTIPLPFTPVPITLQTLAVAAGGIVLGRDGVYSILLYLLLGAFGLPMFAEGSTGFTSLFGATGGYLVGFVAASALIGRYVHPTWAQTTFRLRAFKLFAISLVIFLPGVIQLSLVLNISLAKALMLGFVPFIPGDILKTLMAAGTPSAFIRK